MVPSPPLDYTRYLAAKRTVDDRALHGGVWASAAAAVAAVADATLPPRGEGGGVLRVCDAGAGVGATLVRFLERGFFPTDVPVEYTLVDVKASNLAEARRVLAATAGTPPVTSTKEATTAVAAPVAGAATHTTAHTGDTAAAAAPPPPPLLLPGRAGRSPPLTVLFQVGDAVAHAAAHRGTYHLVVASALLDLFADLGGVVRRLCG